MNPQYEFAFKMSIHIARGEIELGEKIFRKLNFLKLCAQRVKSWPWAKFRSSSPSRFFPFDIHSYSFLFQLIGSSTSIILLLLRHCFFRPSRRSFGGNPSNTDRALNVCSLFRWPLPNSPLPTLPSSSPMKVLKSPYVLHLDGVTFEPKDWLLTGTYVCFFCLSQADKINTLTSAAKVECEAIWATLLAKVNVFFSCSEGRGRIAGSGRKLGRWIYWIRLGGGCKPGQYHLRQGMRSTIHWGRMADCLGILRLF